MYTLTKEDMDTCATCEATFTKMTSFTDDQQQWTSTFDRLFYSYQRYNELRRKDDAIKERFNDLQSKLQELDVLHQSSEEFVRTNTPLSRDSGIPVRSSSSCCSLTSDSGSTPKSSFEHPICSSPQTSTLHFYLHPPDDLHRHVTVHLNEPTTNMSSYAHDSMTRYPSHGRNVHWNDESSTTQSTHPRRSVSQHLFRQDSPSNCYSSDPMIIKNNESRRISLNASLPFEAKLNIRIHTDRPTQELMIDNEGTPVNQIKATATIESLDTQRSQDHVEQLRGNYSTHYSTPHHRPERRSSIQQRESRRDQLPRHRQVSLPISLPIDQRLYLYIRNGEVLARC